MDDFDLHKENKKVSIQGFEGTWQIYGEAVCKGETRYVVLNIVSESMMIVSCRAGAYHRISGPVKEAEIGAAATAILFYEPCRLDAIKCVAATAIILDAHIDRMSEILKSLTSQTTEED